MKGINGQHFKIYRPVNIKGGEKKAHVEREDGSWGKRREDKHPTRRKKECINETRTKHTTT